MRQKHTTKAGRTKAASSCMPSLMGRGSCLESCVKKDSEEALWCGESLPQVVRIVASRRSWLSLWWHFWSGSWSWCCVRHRCYCWHQLSKCLPCWHGSHLECTAGIWLRDRQNLPPRPRSEPPPWCSSGPSSGPRQVPRPYPHLLSWTHQARPSRTEPSIPGGLGSDSGWWVRTPLLCWSPGGLSVPRGVHTMVGCYWGSCIPGASVGEEGKHLLPVWLSCGYTRGSQGAPSRPWCSSSGQVGGLPSSSCLTPMLTLRLSASRVEVYKALGCRSCPAATWRCRVEHV